MAYIPYYNPYMQPMYGQNGAMPDAFAQMKAPYQQPQMQTQQMVGTNLPLPTPTNEFLWVLSINEAESYPVAPNCSVTLWDKNSPVLYIKSANAQGVPSMKILDYTERTAEAPKMPSEHVCQCSGKYVPKEQFELLQSNFTALSDKFERLNSKLNDFSDKINTKSTTKTVKTEV